MLAEAEGLAAQILDRYGFDAPTDPWRIADALGVEVLDDANVSRAQIGVRNGRWTVRLPPGGRAPRRGMHLLHELAHPIALAAGLGGGDQVAWWIASALLLPRETFLRQRRRCGWDVERLAELHPAASHEAIGRRFVMTENCRLWVWDREGPRTGRYRVESPGWCWPRSSTPLPVELEALEAAFESNSAVEPIGGVRAWRVDDGPWKRLLCLSDAEVISGA